MPPWWRTSVHPHHPVDWSQGVHQPQERWQHRLALLPGQGEECEEGDLHPEQADPPWLLLHLGGQEVPGLDLWQSAETVNCELCSLSM